MATLRESMAWFSKIIPIYLMSILIETTLATLDEDSVLRDFVIFSQGKMKHEAFCLLAYRDPKIRVEFENVEVLCHLFLSVSRYSSVITKA